MSIMPGASSSHKAPTNSESETARNGSGNDSGGDSCFGWLVVAGSHVCNLFVFGWYQAIGPLFAVVQRYFDETSARTSWILAFLVFLEASIGPFSNVFIKRVGYRTTVLIGTIMSSTGFFISAFARNIEFLYFSLGILVGIGYGLIIPAHLGIFSHYIKKRFSLANSIVMSGSGIGTFVFPPLTQYLISKYGWKGSLIIFSAINSQLAISAVMFRKPKTADFESGDAEARKSEDGDKSNKCGNICEICDFTLFAKYPVFTVYALTNFLAIGIGFQSLPAHLFTRAESMALGTEDQVALILSFFGIGNILGRWFPPVVKLCSKKGMSSTLWYGLSILAMGIVSLCSVFATSYGTYSASACLIGFLSGVYPVMANLVMIDIAGQGMFTAAVGFTSLMISLGSLIGPPVAGYIYDVTGDYNNSFYFYGAFLTFGGLIMLVPEPCLKRQQKMADRKEAYEDASEIVLNKSSESRPTYLDAFAQTGS
ncbi:monocarboxylate transporter 13-like [Ptychodera flava]|uniref:monocarboxylate transporter 13-like n=1 Tax=Ptychodera flava TaxID=63121 RepID=UPI00396A6BD2